MKRNIALLSILISCILSSCGKEDLQAIFSNGDVVVQTRQLQGDFHTINLHDNVNVILVQSDSLYIEVTSGEYVIDKITAVVENDTLTIGNDNNLNWLRDYDCPYDMIIHYNRLKCINYYSVGSLSNTDSLRGYPRDTADTYFKEVFLNIFEGSGDIDLTVKCNALHTTYRYGTSKVTLKGIAKLNYIFTNSFGSIHAEKLFGNITFLTTKSTNNTYVWFGDYLLANIYSIGNIYYKGNPHNIVSDIAGDGKLYPMEE